MAKRALVTGVTGQDGAWLCAFLAEKDYEIFGLYRRTSSPNFWRLQDLGVFDKVQLFSGDVTDMSSLLECLRVAKPDEVYNLAAQSFVGASFEKPLETANVDALGPVGFLEAIRQVNPSTKFYQASSSETYGNTLSEGVESLNEDSPMRPVSPYAAAKLYSYNMVNIYREAYGLFAVNGILFNHESPLRGLEFVTRKISNGVAKIRQGLETELSLGNVEAARDWGYAPDYVEAMWMMLQQNAPDDYVVATGTAHRVREFAELAFATVGLNWEDYVRVDQRLLRPLEVHYLVGDSTKARERLGWVPKMDFEGLVCCMVEADCDKWRRYRNGKVFPWDAPNYPGDTTTFTRNQKVEHG